MSRYTPGLDPVRGEFDPATRRITGTGSQS